MSKYITYIIIILLIAITVIILSNKYITVYKIYDITEKSNEINKNLPYYNYSFIDVRFFKWINTKYNCINIDWIMKDIKTNEDYKFSTNRCFNSDKKTIKNFIVNKKIFEIWSFVLFLEPTIWFNDDKYSDKIYNFQKDKIIIWLYYVWDFISKYMSDESNFDNKYLYNIEKNLDKVPHIIINL